MTLTVYENAVFHTMDPVVPRAEALVVSAGNVAFVGSTRDCRDFAGMPSRSVDLAGAHVVPGFTDSHTHIGELAVQSSELDLSVALSLEQALAVVAERLAASAGTRNGGDWLLGGHWNQQFWNDRAMPDKKQLDAVTGAVPTALRSADMHSYWLNSAALKRLGIDHDVPDPAGGSYLRDTDGELTGITTEAATFALQDRLQSEAGGRLDSAVEAALQSFLRVGVTTVHDIDGPDALRCFRELRSADRLPVRVHKLLPMAGIDDYVVEGIRSGDGDEWLSLGAVKIFADGALSSRSCLLHDPYFGEEDYRGLEVTPAAELLRLARRCNENGLAVAIHAIGDAGVSNAIAALRGARGGEQSDSVHPGRRSALPNRIEHVQHLLPADLSRLAAVGAVACMQPASCTSDIDTVERELGDRPLISYGWRSISDAGVTVAFSSDAPVESTDPFTGIHAATTRTRADGSPRGGWQSRECVTRQEALAAYTTAGAVASGSSDIAGTLTAGRVADFAVLDRDMFAVDDTSLLQTVVTMTVVGGETRWEG